MTLTEHPIPSPIGELKLILSEKGICALLWEKEEQANRIKFAVTPQVSKEETALFKRVRAQLDEYFKGKRKSFDLPLDMEGTSFQIKAWQALQQIPYGETASYQEQAERIGDRNFARAVGMANSRNPISIIVPCHRVIGKDGEMTGFAGGLEAKKFLLELEKARA